jgi:hypothetical protein
MQDESKPPRFLLHPSSFILFFRRYLSLCALLFWQGGFLFYAVVIIPIAGRALESNLHLRALITGEATNWLNGVGVVVLALLLWDVASSVDASRWRNRGRGVCWAVQFLALAGLFGLHYWLDLLDPPGGAGPTNRAVFGAVHDFYVGVALIQSVAALVYLGLTLSAWRAEDAKRAAARESMEDMRGRKL